MEEIEYWEAVCSRNRAFDGVFVYAVRSTGIYCRPSCPSRRPRREHVQFFGSPAGAEQAGYRACRRCQPDKRTPDEPNLALVQRICRYLSEPRDQIPTLDELAQEFHLSPYHLQRTFKRIVGVTPRQYAEAQRLERFKAGLKQGESVTDALYEAGYASNSSAYTQAARQFGMTPATYRAGGAAAISYTVAESPLGWLLVAGTTKGLCAVRLGDSPAALEMELGRRIPRRSGDAGRCGIGRAGDSADGLPARRAAAPRPAAGRSSDRVSAASLARAAGDPGRQHTIVRGGRRRHRPADRGAGRGTRLRHQPCRPGDPVSPGDPGGRRAGRLSLGAGAEAALACARSQRGRRAGWRRR